MATTFKIFLDLRHQKKNNTYPIKVRIVIDRRSREISLNIFIEEKYWNKRLNTLKHTHPNYKVLQLNISNKLTELQEKSYKLENQGKVVTLNNVSSYLTNTNESVMFFSFARREIDTLIRTGRIGNSIAYSCAVNKLKSFLLEREIRFEEIDYTLLENFTNSMIDEGLKVNAIASYMREIRALYNKAIKKDVVELKYYPFLKYKIKTEPTKSRSLTIEELRKLVQLNITGRESLHAQRNLFLLSFCLIGINFADLLTINAKDVVDDRIVFNRKKTNKVYSIKLTTTSRQLLSKLQAQFNLKTEYLLPIIDSRSSLIKQKKDIALVIHANNDNMKTLAGLAGINKPISTYYARYSWANIARSLGYSKDLIAEALGHEYGNKVTGIYLDNFDKELIDNMNETVLKSIFH